MENSSNNIVFKCKSCGHRLTNLLGKTAVVLNANNRSYFKDNNSYVQKGCYYIEKGEGGTIQYFIHTEDGPN